MEWRTDGGPVGIFHVTSKSIGLVNTNVVNVAASVNTLLQSKRLSIRIRRLAKIGAAI